MGWVNPSARFFQSETQTKKSTKQETVPLSSRPSQAGGGGAGVGGWTDERRGGEGSASSRTRRPRPGTHPRPLHVFFREGAVRRLHAHAQQSCHLTCYGDRLGASGQGFLRADDFRNWVAHPPYRDGAREELESPSRDREHGQRVRLAGQTSWPGCL